MQLSDIVCIPFLLMFQVGVYCNTYEGNERYIKVLVGRDQLTIPRRKGEDTVKMDLTADLVREIVCER